MKKHMEYWSLPECWDGIGPGFSITPALREFDPRPLEREGTHLL
jgi:hypothetical protein